MKLASAKGFKNHGDVKNILERLSKNTDLELYQRVLGTLMLIVESKRLARYNVALRNSQ